MKIRIEFEAEDAETAVQVLKGIDGDLQYAWKRIPPAAGDRYTLTDDEFHPVGKVTIE